MLIRKVIAFVVLCLFSVSAFCMQVNINTASADEIAEALIGIGKKKAAAIVAYRKQHGDFISIEQLSNVKGIGEKTIEKNRSDIQL